MSEPEQDTGGLVIAPAVAAAIRDILAALEADAGAQGTQGAGSGEPVGHGTIRLRGRPDGPAPVVMAAEPVGHGTIRLRGRTEEPAPVAVAAEPVGHGTIRLRGRPDGPRSAKPVAAPPAEPSGPAGPVGHGTIRLHGRPVESPSPPAGALDPRADILAASAANP